MAEVETKLRAHPNVDLPALDDLDGVVVQPPVSHDLRASYWDTEDLRLIRSGATVRHRDTDGDGGTWQVKLPVPGAAREGATVRTERHFQGSSGRPPAAVRREVAALIRTAELQRVARLRTRRQVRILQREGEPIGELADDEVTVYVGRRLVTRFREIEVELVDDQLRQAIASRLLAAGAHEAPQHPKLVEALGPAALEPPAVVVPATTTPDPDQPVRDIVRRALLVDLDAMITHHPGARRGEDDEELHQLRVATRRLRSTLRTFRPVLDRDWAEDLRARLAGVAADLGAVRDLDVLIDRVERDARRLDGRQAKGVAPLRERLERRRRAARRTLLASLDSPPHAELLEDLVGACDEPVCLQPDAPAAPTLAPLADAAWTKVRKAEGVLELHDLRLLIKRLRYAADAVVPAFGDDARALAKAAGRAQDLLGRYQDAHVARASFESLLDAEGITPDEAYTLGVLSALADRRMRRAAAGWPEEWARLRRRRLRRFLRPS